MKLYYQMASSNGCKKSTKKLLNYNKKIEIKL